MYYRKLVQKANDFGEEPFSYNEREIKLSKEKYHYFLNLINQSGYWKMKPIIHPCPGEATHADTYILEAATKNQYNYVQYGECYYDTSSFGKVISELMTFSKIRENESKRHDSLFKKRSKGN